MIDLEINVVSSDIVLAVQVGGLTVYGGGGGEGGTGESAYDVAVNNGYVGTESQWLLSLRGAQGLQGPAGSQGAQGIQGPAGDAGAQGIQGVKGDTGNQGIQGPQGPAGADGSSFSANSLAVVTAIADPATSKIVIEEAGVAKRITLANLGQAADTLTDAGTVLASDIVTLNRGGVDYKTTMTAIAAAVALINGGTPDTTAPTLSSPTGTQTGTTTASGTVTTNEANGTLYFMASINATETAATVKAGATQAISSTGSKSVAVTGLTANTLYYMHYLHRDAAGNDSTVSNSASFTTAAAGDTTAPVLSLPLGTQTGSTTASGGATTNEANGTLYRYISANSTETAATIKAANLTTAVSATGAVAVAFTGLTANTLYYAHYVHRDAAGNDSNVVSSASFTTAAAGAAPTAGVTSLAGTSGDDSVTLTWVNASGGTGWRVEQSPTGANTWTTSTLAVAATSTGAKVGGLAGATGYDFRVTVFNGSGDGPSTTLVNKVTLAAMIVSGYSGNAVKTAISVSSSTASTYSSSQGTLRGLLFDKTAATQYWAISNPPASAKCGWSNSSTVPPAEITDAQNLAGGSSVNGMSPMAKPGQFVDDNYLWLDTNTNTGTSNWYFWVLPLNGHAQCMNAGAPLAITLAA